MINVQNKSVEICRGKKRLVIKNHITDKYLKYVNLGQFKDEQYTYKYNREKYLKNVAIKFDTPIVDLENSTKTDYDVYITNLSYSINGNSSSCEVVYGYDSQNSFKKALDDSDANFNDYAGRRIVALGFFYENDILAYIDTSSFDLKLVENETLFIKRDDLFTSNAECVGIEYFKHIAPTRDMVFVWNSSDYTYDPYTLDSFLYSVGFGTKKGKMSYEYVLDNDDIDIIRTDTTFSFVLKTGDKITLYPHSSLMPSGSKYPLKMYSLQELHPSNSLYSSNNKYPLKSNFKYIILKYRLYKTNSNGEQIPTDKFYTMNLKNEYIGLFEVLSKIERRT